MKKLALTIIISVAGVALSAEEFTIQTISAQKENSITPAFEKKVQKSALESTKKKEGSCNIVTVGRYDSVKKARADLAKAKKIAKDAFVRPVERSVPKTCGAAASGSKKEEKTAKADANASGAGGKQMHAVTEKQKEGGTAEKVIETAAVEKPKEAAIAEKPKEAVATPAPAAASVPAPKVAAETVRKTQSEPAARSNVILYDRNMARKSDLHEAIEYYKTSPYHTFKPVALQSR